MVLRLGAAIPNTKDLELFFKVAKRCPSHRFVMALVFAHKLEDHANKIIALNKSMGNPVDIRVNLDAAEVAELTRQAGILLHTKSAKVNFGMPVSIAESMATGTYVLTRDCAAARDYLGKAGATYKNENDALDKILATLNWGEADWQRAGDRAIDRAFRRHSDVLVFWPLLRDWLRLTRRGGEAKALKIPAPGS